MFIFGSTRGLGVSMNDDGPRRVAILEPFRMDRYEVTVARWRDALARGFRPPLPAVPNEGPVPTESSDPSDVANCTWSTSPRGREDLPLNCVNYSSARAFCAFGGGDLASEAQWEYVASSAGRDYPTALPWGGDPDALIPCERAVLGRGPFPIDNRCNLDAKHYGPLPVTAFDRPDGDVSLGLGVVNLLGNMLELTRDAFAAFSATCWESQPLASPACLVDHPTEIAVRGGAWFDSQAFVGSRQPFLPNSGTSRIGFRCVRPGN
jgi:formylglycine-generating enzyme required for sulfatase activity